MRIPLISCALRVFNVWGSTHCLDPLSVGSDDLHSEDGCVLQRLPVRINPVRPVVRPEIVPEILDWIQLRRIGRQSQHGHVRGHDHRVTRVIAGTVPDQHRVNIRIQLSRKLFQEEIDHVRIQMRHDNPCGGSAGRAGRGDHPEVVILSLTHSRGSRASLRPDRRQRAFLTEPGFVFEPDFKPLVGVLTGDGFKILADFFLKASWASGSAC